MSQTTDKTRGQRGSVPGGRGRTGAASAPSSPSPPRRRRPALTALAVLLIVGGAALAGWLALRLDSRVPVLVVKDQISTGELITADKLTSVNMSADGVDYYKRDEAGQIVGKLYARQTLHAGQPLFKDVLRTQPPLEDDQAQVGVPLSAGKYPPGLRDGDAVRLTRIGDQTNPSTALATGLVLDVTTSKAGGFGSDAKASVALILIPQSVSDQVVGATGTDDLGIAIIDRGVDIEDADISALTSTRGGE